MRTALVMLASALVLIPGSSPAIPPAVMGVKLNGITFNANADNPVVFLMSFRLAIREGDDITATGFFQCREHPAFHSPCPSSSRGTVTAGQFHFDFGTGLSNTTLSVGFGDGASCDFTGVAPYSPPAPAAPFAPVPPVLAVSGTYSCRNAGDQTTSAGYFFTRGARMQLPKCKGLSTTFCTPY